MWQSLSKKLVTCVGTLGLWYLGHSGELGHLITFHSQTYEGLIIIFNDKLDLLTKSKSQTQSHQLTLSLMTVTRHPIFVTVCSLDITFLSRSLLAISRLCHGLFTGYHFYVRACSQNVRFMSQSFLRISRLCSGLFSGYHVYVTVCSQDNTFM